MNLGTLADIVSVTASDDRITLAISDNGGERYECTIISDSNNGEQRYFIPKCEGNPPTPLSTAAPFGFTYLCAERDGPRDSQELQSNSKEAMQVGAKGEYAADVVSGLEYEDVRDLMLHTSQAQSAVKNRQLRHNLELWMQDFFPGILIEASRVENINGSMGN